MGYTGNGRVVGMTQQQTGATIMKLAPALAAIPVVGVFAAAGAEIVGGILAIFGNKYNTSTGVRWLTQYYEKYVLGMDTHSDNTVNEANATKAQAWFSYVLGVPVYDKYRLGALMGYDTDGNRSLNWTDEEKVTDYLKYEETAGIDRDVVMQAVHIASKMRWTDPLGSWAGFTAAPSMIDNTQTEGSPSGGGSGTGASGNGEPDNKKKFMILGALALAAVILFSDGD